MSFLLKKIKVHSLKQPKTLAIDSDKFKISYQSMWKLIQSFSNFIVSKNLNQKIVIMGDIKSLSYLAILSCIYSGVTYIPISHNTPKKRLNEIIKISRSKLILNFSKKKFVSLKNTKVINIDNLDFFENLKKKKKLQRKENKIIYIIFTSGSTGDPKGVCISKKSLDHYLIWLNKNFNIKKNKRCSQYPDIGFDLSIVDIMGTFCGGGTLVPVEKNIDKFFPGQFINKKKITHWVSVPSTIDLIINSNQLNFGNFHKLERIFFCGEPLHKYHLKKLFFANKKLLIINAYGPTEATVSCSYLLLNSKNYTNYIMNNVSFGKAIPKMIFKIDRQLGEEFGELLISGPQLFSSYLKKKDLYFQKIVYIKNKLFYRTGDIVKKINSNYYFFSRKDRQIKKSGYRIELEDIDSNLRKLGCSFAFSFFIKKKRIVSLVKSKIKIKKLYKDLNNNLPVYMLPEIYKIDKVPINLNRKVDLKKLENIANLKNEQNKISFRDIKKRA